MIVKTVEKIYSKCEEVAGKFSFTKYVFWYMIKEETGWVEKKNVLFEHFAPHQ